MLKEGKVYLVGAGPGSPDLITVRGLHTLKKADIVVYDRLVHPQLLQQAPGSALFFYVGKKPGNHWYTQKQIQQLLIEQAQQGKHVVRLKGGDPFVFGRGGEECMALAHAGIDFEVIPGLTSAISVPTYCGIPLTYRGMASSFFVISGHNCHSNVPQIPWQALTEDTTLVFLMGIKNLTKIVALLLQNGYAIDTPVAVIRWGTTEKQQKVVGTLCNIAEKCQTFRPPAIVIVGNVVKIAGNFAHAHFVEENSFVEELCF